MRSPESKLRLVSGRESKTQLVNSPMDCCCTSRSSTRSFPCTPACGNTGVTSSHWRNGRALSPTLSGGSSFLRDSGGTGFWHETYFMRGGMEAIYDDLPVRFGLSAFAPVHPARGAMFAARGRLKTGGAETKPVPFTESDLYAGEQHGSS